MSLNIRRSCYEQHQPLFFMANAEVSMDLGSVSIIADSDITALKLYGFSDGGQSLDLIQIYEFNGGATYYKITETGLHYINSENGNIVVMQGSGTSHFTFNNGGTQLTFTGGSTYTSSRYTGNAATSPYLETYRTFTVSGDLVAGGQSFNGQQAITLTTTLQADTIDTSNIQDNAVTTVKIVDGNVGSSELVSHATDDASRAVATADIGTGAVTDAKFAGDTIVTADLADACVTSAKFTTNSVATADISDSTVGSSVIADATLTASDLATDCIGTSELTTNSIAGADICCTSGTAGSITTVKMADLTVGTSELADNSISDDELATDCVETGDIADDAVTSAKINFNYHAAVSAATSAGSSTYGLTLTDSGDVDSNLDGRGRTYSININWYYTPVGDSQHTSTYCTTNSCADENKINYRRGTYQGYTRFCRKHKDYTSANCGACPNNCQWGRWNYSPHDLSFSAYWPTTTTTQCDYFQGSTGNSVYCGT